MEPAISGRQQDLARPAAAAQQHPCGRHPATQRPSVAAMHSPDHAAPDVISLYCGRQRPLSADEGPRSGRRLRCAGGWPPVLCVQVHGYYSRQLSSKLRPMPC